MDDDMLLIAAKNAVNFILTHLKKANNRLLHRYREGIADFDAYIDESETLDKSQKNFKRLVRAVLRDMEFPKPERAWAPPKRNESEACEI